MSNTQELIELINPQLSNWDAEHRVLFIRTNDNTTRYRLQRAFNGQGVPTVNIYTRKERIEEMINEHKFVVVISAIHGADRFLERSEELLTDIVSQRVVRLDNDGNPHAALEPAVGEAVIQYS